MFSQLLWPTVKVQVSGVAAELPYGAEETCDVAVTAKAVLKASRTYYNDEFFMKLRTGQDWFDNRSKVSFYYILDADTTLEIGNFLMKALDDAVSIILTSTQDSSIIHVVGGAGKLRVTDTAKHTVRYRKGDNDIAGYIEYTGPILPLRIANQCYYRAIKRIF